MKQTTRKTYIISLLCIAFLSISLAFATLGGSQKTFAEDADVNYKTTLYVPNSVYMGSKAPSYVYYDVNENGKMEASSESYIYCDNRFNPSQDKDVALVWTAPSDGTLNTVADSCKIVLNEKTRSYDSADGIRYSIVKLDGDYSHVFMNDYHASWKSLEFNSGETSQADISESLTDLTLKQGESIAIVINCGENKNNSYDEAAIYAKFEFTPSGGTAVTYTFGKAWLTAQGNALNNKTEYPLFTQATGYFGWGTLKAEEDYSDVIRPTDTKNDYLQVEDYEGIYFYDGDKVIMSKTTSYVWCDDNENKAYDKAGEVGIYADKRFSPSTTADAALWWTAPEDGKISIDENALTIVLNEKKAESETADGIRYKVVIISKADGKETETILTENEWNNLAFTSKEKTETAISAVVDKEVKKDDRLAVIINCGENGNNTCDETTISAKIKFTPKDDKKETKEGDEKETKEYKFDGANIKSQGSSINSGKEYLLNCETAGYFGWGALKVTTVGDDKVTSYTEPNGVEMVITGPSYVYYDADANEKHDTANESYIYCDNRFNPSKTSDVGLWWTAPEDGKFSIDENALMIVLNEKFRDSESPDGIRYAIIIAGEDGSITPLTVNLWNDLAYTPKTKTRAALNGAVTDKVVKNGDKLAVIINCGENGSNTYDEASIYVKISFTPDGGTEEKYIFRSSWLNEQGQAIFDGKEYILNGESANYFGWGKVYLNKERETFDSSKAYAFGEVQATSMDWNGQRWYGNSICVAYPDKVSESSGKYPWIRMQPDFGKNVAAIFTATEDCEAAITRLHLAKSGRKNIRNADGVRWAIVYKTTNEKGEAKYYSVNDTVWTHHEFDGRYGETIIKTHTDFPNVTMKSGDQLMLVFDNNKKTGYDTIAVQIDLQYVLSSGELKTCNLLDEIKPNDTMTYEHWSFAYLKMGQDYSDTVIGEVDNVKFESVGKIETEELSYDFAASKWLSYEYPDISVYSENNLYYISPDETRAVAIALKIGKAGRIMFDEDTYIRLDSAGASNGVRFRILKNDEIIYPSQNGWKYTRNENKLSISGMPVLEIGEDDVIYFVLDSFGDSSSDTTECNFVVHFAEDTDVYTESYIFSDSYAETARNGWGYYAINFVNEPYSGVIKSSSGSGCSSSVDVGVYVIVPLLAVFATVVISRKRRKLK